MTQGVSSLFGAYAQPLATNLGWLLQKHPTDDAKSRFLAEIHPSDGDKSGFLAQIHPAAYDKNKLFGATKSN